VTSVSKIKPSNQKKGATLIQATVLDAQYGFDYPARFLIEHEQVSEIVCYTATYTGQAVQGA
jgi:predicted nucleotidyltransferase